MFAVKDKEQQQKAFASGSKSLDGQTNSAPQIRESVGSLRTLQRNLGNSHLQAIAPTVNPMAKDADGLRLQRACVCGNSCANCAAKGDEQRWLQPKLTVGSPNDRYEQEADRVADQIMRMPEPTIQRQMEPEEEEQEMVQRKAITNQVAPLDSAQKSSEVPPIVHEVFNSPGQPLDPKTCTFMESRFGHDFSRVRVHSGAAAEQSARAVNALAYTSGRDMVFGVGQYAPHTSTGQHLLAHELAHVVQQDGNVRDLQQDSKLGEENDRYEQEAEKSAAQCMSGAQVQVPSRISSTLIQRTKVCSKRLEAPVLGWVFNHSYIDDTGMDNCLGSSMLGNYAVQTLVSGNFVKGCAVKTATSTDPIGRTPNVKQCDPKPGVKDLSRCLLDTYNSYADPSVYKNPFGPNSNTFAATLAKNCCADGSSKGLGWVPGWGHAPALPCPQQPQVFVAAGEEESPQEETAT